MVEFALLWITSAIIVLSCLIVFIRKGEAPFVCPISCIFLFTLIFIFYSSKIILVTPALFRSCQEHSNRLTSQVLQALIHALEELQNQYLANSFPKPHLSKIHEGSSLCNNSTVLATTFTVYLGFL